MGVGVVDVQAYNSRGLEALQVVTEVRAGSRPTSSFVGLGF